MVRLGADDTEAGAGVDASGGEKVVLRPERDAAVAGGARESDALVDQAGPDPEPARAGIDEEEPKLRGLVRVSDDEDAAGVLAIDLGDPAAIASRVEPLDERGHDLGDERLESVVVTVLPRVQRA